MAWYRANPERAREKKRQWDQVNRDRVNQQARERYRNDPTRDLNAKRKYRYGVDGEMFGQMLVEQHGLCAICGEPPGRNRLHVDHCHESGAVRGLLCARCNQGLGFFRDDPSLLAKAMRYLKKHSR